MRKTVVFGTPITPRPLLEELAGSSFCVSYWNRSDLGDQLDRCIDLVGDDEMLLVDNGAFSAWMSGETLDREYWSKYETWAANIAERCPQAVVVVPDVIDGSESDNEDLVAWFVGRSIAPGRLMPVWHMHESLGYLRRLLQRFNFVAIGSSGEYAKVGTPIWHKRIDQAMHVIREERHEGSRPHIHMMRAQGQHARYDFDSSDSSNVARNHCRYRHEGKGHIGRFAARVRARIEATCSGEQVVPTPAEVTAALQESTECPSTTTTSATSATSSRLRSMSSTKSASTSANASKSSRSKSQYSRPHRPHSRRSSSNATAAASGPSRSFPQEVTAMATRKRNPGRPRLSEEGTRKSSVTLDRDIYSALQMMSEMEGIPISRIINEQLRAALLPSKRIKRKAS